MAYFTTHDNYMDIGMDGYPLSTIIYSVSAQFHKFGRVFLYNPSIHASKHTVLLQNAVRPLPR